MKIQTKARVILVVTLILSMVIPAAMPVRADSTAQTLPFSQNWSNTGLITTNNDWSGVPGIIGYRGDDITTGIGIDPQTLLADGTGTPFSVLANQTNPSTNSTGAVAEFDTLADPVVAMQGSATADAPFLLLAIDTTGKSNISVSYNIRDIDGAADNAVQPVALHYRIGNTGNFTNIPAGFVADATTGPSLATLVTPVSVTLPAVADNQPVVQLRIMTTNATGSDEWVGIDDISVTSAPVSTPTITQTPTNGPTLTPTITQTPTETTTPTATIPPLGACGTPATPIHDIQGNGTTSPLNGTSGVIIEGVVVGDYQAANQFGGFHVQEEDADVDADPATSEGIFVFDSGTPVSVGDLVRVRGTVFEFTSSGTTLTELSPVTDVLLCSSGNSVTASTVTLPISNINDWEHYEGMSINISQPLTVTETFTLARFGEVALSVGGRLFNPTTLTTPGAAAIAQQDLNDRSRILLDDGDNNQNIDPTIHPVGGLSATNTLRSGYTIPSLTGVLEQRFGVYRVQPVGPISFSANNPRPAVPDAVGGRLKVAAMNVLNFFTTLDTSPTGCGPLGTLECRGANTSQEFTRQRDKILSQMLALNADVYGLMELENNASNSPLQSLVDGLNAATAPGTYDYIHTGVIGGDAIKVGLVYKVSTVTPVGAYALLTSSVDPTFIDTLNRPVLAQTFSENSTSERFTVAVNHLKSKGSACSGDPDTGDGQGNCNLTRTAAAQAEANWLAGDPTSSGDPDFILLGDFNAYFREDPITSFISAGYTDLIDSFVGAGAYSYVFGGQSGYLDHALSSTSLTSQVTGVTEWHNNADEPIALDYNTEFKTVNQINTFYLADAFRVSDHDPLLVGLDLSTPATATPTPTATATSTSTLTSTVTHTATITPTATETLTLTETETATLTATATETSTATSTPTPTVTETPTLTATITLTSTETETATTTYTPTVTSTFTTTASPTETMTATATLTPTDTATITWTPSPTGTVTVTMTATNTATPTQTSTSTVTRTPTITPTKTPATIILRPIAAHDGWVLETTETSNVGGVLYTTGETLNLGDVPAKKQYRVFLSFNTGARLPDTAVVTAVTLKIKLESIVGGGNPVSIFKGIFTDVKNGFFGTAAALQSADFQAAASGTYGPSSPSPVHNVYSINLTNAKAHINKLATSNGLTQLRLRFKLDDNNDAVANYLSLFSGNTVNLADRPQLVITYIMP